MQAATGLPWWATIASSTIFVRTALFPLVRSQIIHGRKLGQTIPELNFLFQLLRQRLSGLKASSAVGRKEIFKIFTVFFRGVGACFRLHDVKLSRILGLPLINLAVFVTFIMSIRDMIIGDHEYDALFTEELFWLDGLHMKDKTMLLPIGAVAMSYIALEVSFAASTASRLLLLIKDVLQCGFILFLPYVAPLPAGVFFYWIPSSAVGMLQTLLLRRPMFMRIMGIPPLPVAANAMSAVAAGAATTTVAAVGVASTVVTSSSPSLGAVSTSSAAAAFATAAVSAVSINKSPTTVEVTATEGVVNVNADNTQTTSSK